MLLLKKLLRNASILSIGLVACNTVSPKEEFSIRTEPEIDEISGDTVKHFIPSFNFINQDEKWVSDTDLKGKIYVADFFFTTCPTICPLMTKQMLRVQNAFKNDTSVRLISFTVNPDTDSSTTLKKYALLKGANLSKWDFCTGEKQKIYALGQKGFLLITQEERDKEMEFLHSDKLVLVDKTGRIRGHFSGTDSSEVNQLIQQINTLR